MVALGSSDKGGAVSAARPLRLHMYAFINIKIAPIKSPGRTPPKNKNPIEESDTKAYNTMGIDGGMMGPMVADAAVRAAA